MKTGDARLPAQRRDVWRNRLKIRATTVRFLSPKGEGSDNGGAAAYPVSVPFVRCWLHERGRTALLTPVVLSKRPAAIPFSHEIQIPRAIHSVLLN